MVTSQRAPVNDSWIAATVIGDVAVAGHVGANTRIVDWLGRRVIPG